MQVTQTRKSRTMAALAVKDEQYQRVSVYNMQLLKTMNTLDDEKKSFEMEREALEQENRVLREKNFEMQSKVRVSKVQMQKSENELEDKGKQHKIMSDHNSELLRLLEKLELDKSTKSYKGLKEELEDLRGKYASPLSTAKSHEAMATQAAHQGQLRAEEVRLLRAEAEQLRNANKELKMKAQVEVESLQVQLGISKEKQYQLLQKLQSDEEAKHQAEDQVASMENNLRSLHEKKVELETQLQVEIRCKTSQIDANKDLTIQLDNYANSNKKLQEKLNEAEQERLRIEAEAHDSADQLTKMSEKLFQLLERMKLSEMGKKKAVEALKSKEQEVVSLQKKNGRLLQESNKEGRSRVKAELDKKVLQDQIQALKKHNSRLNNKCGDEVNKRLKESEALKASQEKLQQLGARLSFLLKKIEADEESRVMSREEMKKMQAQLHTLQERNQELQTSLTSTTEGNRLLTQSMRTKQEEYDELNIKYEALEKKISVEDDHVAKDRKNQDAEEVFVEEDGTKNVAGKGHFYVEAQSSQSIMLLKPKQEAHKSGRGIAFLDRLKMNAFLKRAQKSNNVKQQLVEKIGQLVSLLLDKEVKATEHKRRQISIDDHIEHLTKKIIFMQDRLSTEEDAKRRTLLRYIHAVKTASNTIDTSNAKQKDLSEILLPESGIGDEEVHAIAALLRGSTTIRRLALKNNSITNEGARALAAILATNSFLESVDLRGNHIDDSGTNALAEALERNKRIRHVYVHGGGKIVGLGAHESSAAESSSKVDVETVCEVDVRDNTSQLSNDQDSDNFSGSLLLEQSAPVVPMRSPKRKQGLNKKKELERTRQTRKGKIENTRTEKANANLPPLTSEKTSKSKSDTVLRHQNGK